MSKLSNGQVIFFLYYVSINIVAYMLMYKDKLSAINNKRRIPEKTLINFSLVGAALGIMIGMLTLQHKVKKRQFYIKIPIYYLTTHSVMLYIYVKYII